MKKVTPGGRRRIRKASIADVAAITEIGKECFPASDISEEKTLSRISRGHVIFICEIEGKMAGFSDILLGLTRASVSGIATRKEFRGLGIATSLLEHSISLAKKTGKLSVSLRVAARNLRALNIYEKLGFSVVKRKARRDGRIVYTMVRNFET
ncbi:MAG: GNAT family N-acetyltransferase [Candidatus Micrarchaeota archaeon]